MKLHEKIRFLRKERGMSQEELAEKAEINISYLSRLENGHNEPSVEVFKRLVDAFGVSADYLLNEEEENYEIQIRDRNLAEKIRLIDALDEKKREALIEIIDALLTNQKMRQLIEGTELKSAS